VLARAAVRSFLTQKLTPKEYDSWAWARAPVSKTGPLFSAEMKRRTTAGGSSLLTWRFAFFAPRDPHTSCMTCGPGSPCHSLGCFGARRARFSMAPWGSSGRVFLEKGFTPRAAVTLSHSLQLLRPFAFELSAPLCICAPLLSAVVVVMASLVHPERFQSEVALNLVCNLLGWGMPAFAGRIRADASPLGDLAVGEFVLFVSYLSCGLALPISPFFLLLLEELGLKLQHLTPHSILQVAIFAHLCGMFMGVALLPPVLGRKGVAQRPSGESELSYGSIFRMDFTASCSGLVNSSLNFTSTSWYASMNWSSFGSVSAARPPSTMRCRASICLALMASMSPPTMGSPSP
jgi:hypothetical protein